jgi:hypothetical protein
MHIFPKSEETKELLVVGGGQSHSRFLLYLTYTGQLHSFLERRTTYASMGLVNTSPDGKHMFALIV